LAAEDFRTVSEMAQNIQTELFLVLDVPGNNLSRAIIPLIAAWMKKCLSPESLDMRTFIELIAL
jgi:hypothetical protein